MPSQGVGGCGGKKETWAHLHHPHGLSKQQPAMAEIFVDVTGKVGLG